MRLSLLYEMTRRDFTDRYVGSVLGVFWAFLWPLVNIFVYLVIFSKVMGAKLPGNSSVYSYSVYLVSGLIPWVTFSNSLIRATTVFSDKKHILSKVPMKIQMLPLVIVASEAITCIITFALFFVFLIATGYQITTGYLVIIAVFIVQLILTYSLGLCFAALNVFLRDFKEFVGISLQLWFWMTPIVYVVDIVPDRVKDLFFLNPAYLFVNIYQDTFVNSSPPGQSALVLISVVCAILLPVSLFIFNKLEKDIRDFI